MKVKEYLNEIQAGVSDVLKGIGGNIDSTFENIGMVAAAGVMTAGTAAWKGAVNAVTSVKSWLEDYAGSNESVIEGSVGQLSDSPESDAEEMARDMKYKSHIYKSTNPETYVKRLAAEYRKRGEDVTEDDIKNAFAEANHCSWDEVREMFLQGGQRIYELDGMGWNKTVQDKYTAEEAERIIREINEGVKLIAESMERLLEQPDTNTVVRNAGTEKGILDEFASDLHSWAAEVRKGPNEFGEYIGNNLGAGLAACIVGSILGPAVSLGFGEALAAAPVWAPAVTSYMLSSKNADGVFGAVTSGVSYTATTDNFTWGGLGIQMGIGYGTGVFGNIASAKVVDSIVKYSDDLVKIRQYSNVSKVVNILNNNKNIVSSGTSSGVSMFGNATSQFVANDLSFNNFNYGQLAWSGITSFGSAYISAANTINYSSYWLTNGLGNVTTVVPGLAGNFMLNKQKQEYKKKR